MNNKSDLEYLREVLIEDLREAAERIAVLKRSLRSSDCPRPINPETDDGTVGHCVDHGVIIARAMKPQWIATADAVPPVRRGKA